jgi:uroporphyrinogen-III synthase
MRPVLVTRSEPGATRTVARLTALGYTTINAATAQVIWHDVVLDLAGDDALALTSPNGAVAAGGLVERRDTEVFAVGAATADMARAQGFTNVLSADGDGAALAALIAQRSKATIVHVRGRDKSFDLTRALTRANVKAREVIAYAAEPVPALRHAALEAVSAHSVVLVHSPKGAARFVKLVRQALTNTGFGHLRAAAISDAAAEPLRAHGFGRVEVATQPDEPALLEALSRTMR